MNLKERGITVGDLILVVIFVISTVLIIDKVKERDDQAYFKGVPNQILNIKNS